MPLANSTVVGEPLPLLPQSRSPVPDSNTDSTAFLLEKSSTRILGLIR